MTKETGVRYIRRLIQRFGFPFYRIREATTYRAARITQAYWVRGRRKRVLFIEDRVPHIHLGAGFPRTNLIITTLIRMGFSVTLYPTMMSQEDWSSIYDDLPLRVRVIREGGLSGLPDFVREFGSRFDLLFVSRPHNLAALRSLLDEGNRSRKTKVIYDAEAIFSLRDIEQKRQQGAPLSPGQARRLVDEELKIGKGSSSIISVSESESRLFVKHGFERVYTLGHAVKVSPTPNNFEARAGVLFVGAIHGEATPNADSIKWFVKEILPLMRKQLGDHVKFFIAGLNTDVFLNQLAGDGIEVLGKLDDLTALYNNARLFVAPTRFAAGIPLKIYEAAAHGLPVVTTPLIANQLGWNHEVELLTGDDATAFAASSIRLYRERTLWEQLRSNALERLKRECSSEVFEAKLKRIIEELSAPVEVSGKLANAETPEEIIETRN